MNRCLSFTPFAFGLWLTTTVFAATSPGAGAKLSLAGTWRFRLDRADVGIAERWFAQKLAQHIRLPGALQNQGFGDNITVDTKWTGEVGTDRWKQRPEYEKYRQPGNIKVPFFLQPEKHYVGAAWYQRDIEIPSAWAGKRVVLTLERPHWGTHVWLDDRFIGTNLSLSTPHVYEFGVDLKPGNHTLTIRVDNRVLVEVGDWSHSVSDHTQGNWNGVVGKIELSATDQVWIADLQAYPHVATKSVTVRGRVGNASGRLSTNLVALCVLDRFDARPRLPTTNVAVHWSGQVGVFEATLAIPGEASAWDEFNPRLYELTAWVDDRPDWQERKQVAFGLRNITKRGRQFLLNGRPTFFRGTLECCIFPKTGYPPTDVESWKRIIRICKEYGLNHIRFHSWCPPEAAFTAADELGFYYQVECGVWTSPGNGKPIDQWIYDESERIVRAYGNHPSFMLLTHGNEPHGPRRDEYLAKWVNHWKRDGRFLVTSGSAYPQLPENQYHVFHPCRGPHGWLGKDYRKDVEKLDVPVIVHEMGQWCAYPDFDEMKKFTGPLKPKNFEIFRDSLADHGMLDQWRDFLRASGRLQVLCYKEEIEAALRTPGIGGVQLLDLHDFPGQGTALVGVLDSFWDSKGYVTAREFRRFYNTTVPLARLLKRTWTTDETLTCDVELAHFGAAPLTDATAIWKLVTRSGEALASGAFPTRTIPIGQGYPLGRIRVDLSKLATPQTCKLVVSVKDTPFENDWNVWLYSAAPPSPIPTNVWLATSLDDDALAKLASGQRVLIATSRLSSIHPKLGFEPIFWNRYMFNTQSRQTLGLLCDSRHSALAEFPTDFFQDWQWNDIVTRARGIIMDEWPSKLRPIVQVIDDWNTNRKLGLVVECRVGPGRLLICSADLSQDLDRRPATRQLRESLLAYAASDQFRPQIQISADELTRVLNRASRSMLVNLGAKVVRTDSEDQEHNNLAAYAIDGDPETFWHTRWQPRNDPMPHELVVDLGREITLKGITYLPRQDMANGRVAAAQVFISNSPDIWGSAVANVKGSNSGGLQTVTFASPVKGRYLKWLVTAEVNQNPFAAVAELDVIALPK